MTVRAGPGGRRGLRTARRVLVAGWALLLVAWVVGQPLGAAPDEAAHLVKAIGTATGQGLGSAPDTPPPQGNAFLAGYVRQYELPDGWRIDVRPPCYVDTGEQRGTGADCVSEGVPPRPSWQDLDGDVLGTESAGTGLTYVAPYPPAPYVLPGLLARVAPDPQAAGYLARVGSALGVLLLLALASRAASTRTALLGLAVAVTPMVLFLGGSTSPSGAVTAAAVAAAAGGGLLARLTTRSGVVPDPGETRTAWTALGLGLAVLCLSRPEGPVLAVPLVGAVGLLVAPGGLRRAWRAAPVVAGTAVAAAATAFVVGVVWALAVLPRLPVVSGDDDDASGSAAPPLVQVVASQLKSMASEAVGATGWRDVPFPNALAAAWLLVAAGVVLLSVGRVTGARRRTALLLLAASGPVIYVVSALAVLRPVGASEQGRYVLPLLAGAVVLAAASAPGPAGRRRVALVLALVSSAVVLAGHVTARVVDARRYALGPDGAGGWLLDAPWAPPGGALPWLLAAVAGAVLVGLAPLLPRAADAASPSQEPHVAGRVG